MTIKTSKDLIKALQGDYADSVRTYILADDIKDNIIDLNEKGLRAPSKILADSGPITFDGNGKTIKNFNIKGYGPFVGLFDSIAPDNAVRNLTLQNFSVVNTYSSNNDDWAMASGGKAGIAGNAEDIDGDGPPYYFPPLPIYRRWSNPI